MDPRETAYCCHCKKDVCFHYDPINHGKQLLLTVFTLGLWLPMWLCLALSPTRLCNDCGHPLWSQQG